MSVISQEPTFTRVCSTGCLPLGCWLDLIKPVFWQYSPAQRASCWLNSYPLCNRITMCTETRIEVHKHNAPLAYGCRKAVQQLPHLQAIQYLSILTTVLWFIWQNRFPSCCVLTRAGLMALPPSARASKVASVLEHFTADAAGLHPEPVSVVINV